MTSLLVFSRDPGPTNDLVAIIEALSTVQDDSEAPGLAALRAATASVIGDVWITARPPGDAIWRAAGYEPRLWRGLDQPAASALIADARAGLVLTGASDTDEPGDRVLWQAARRGGIESHVVVDYPVNLGARFADMNGSAVHPDWGYVHDSASAVRLAAAGFPAERIRITGDLHHRRLRRLAASRAPESAQALRATWGAAPETNIILFASECGRETANIGIPSRYDEVNILENLLRVLARGDRPGGGRLDPVKTRVVVRPHPRDDARKYDALVAAWTGAPDIVVSAEGSPDLAIIAADLIVGMNSSLLYEAVVLEKPAVSLTGLDLMAGKSRAG